MANLQGCTKFQAAVSFTIIILTNPNGWILEKSTWDSNTNRIGNSFKHHFPEFDLDMPFASYEIDFESSANLTPFVSIDRGSWIEVNSSSDKHDLSSSASVIQVKYQASEENWT